MTYGELDEAEDEDGPEAAEVGVGEEAAEEGEEEDGADEVGDDVGRFGQGEVHLIDHIGDQVVANRSYPHYLKRLQPCPKVPHISLINDHKIIYWLVAHKSVTIY